VSPIEVRMGEEVIRAETIAQRGMATIWFADG
jgi:plasmid replication initiation protein